MKNFPRQVQQQYDGNGAFEGVLFSHLLVDLPQDPGEVKRVPVPIAADVLQLPLHLHEAHLSQERMSVRAHAKNVSNE